MKQIKLLCMLVTVFLLLAACTGEEDTLSEKLTPDMLSDGVYEALAADWAAYEKLSPAEQLLTSSLPGSCKREFDDWAGAEEFIGLSVPNPAESCEWLEQGTYVGMPLGYMDAPRVTVDWYGTEEGELQWLTLTAGYRSGESRVMVSVRLLMDPPEQGDTVVTRDSGAQYTAAQVVLVRGFAEYTLRIIGEPGTEETVSGVLERLLPDFEGIGVK